MINYGLYACLIPAALFIALAVVVVVSVVRNHRNGY